MTHQVSHFTYFARSLQGYRWTQSPHTGRWEVFAPGGTHPQASARTWHAAAKYALAQSQPPPPAPLHSPADQPQAKA